MASSVDGTSARAAIYCRISRDREGAGLGVDRQREDCQRLAADRGWTVLANYEDNDLSAYSGRARPGYTALLDSVRAGGVDFVLAWHTDRLHRSPRELEEWISACEVHGVGVLTVRAGHLDLQSASGRMVARMLGAAARHESEQKSERIRREREQRALAGKWNGGSRSYGYGADGEIVPEEAAIIRELAARVLAGESLRSLVYDLDRRAVPTLRGGTWRSPTVHQILTAARLSGQREWTPRSSGKRGHGMGDIVAKGQWEAIITPETTARLRALLGDPSRRTWVARKHLLSAGILRCGHCGQPMNARSDPISGARYQCIKVVGSKCCGRMSVVAAPVEKLVTEMVLSVVERADVMPSPPDADPDQVALYGQIETDRERLGVLISDYSEGIVTRAEWLLARTRVEERIRSAESRLAKSARQVALAALPVERDVLRGAWPQMHLDQQRAVILAVVDRVVVQPAKRPGRPRFDPERVRVEWRA